MYIFDTDSLSNIVKSRPSPLLLRRLKGLPSEFQYTTSINVAEIYYGAYRSQKKERILKTFQEKVFPNVLAIKGELSDDVQTITLFASDRPVEPNKGWLDYIGYSKGMEISQTIERLTVKPTREGAFVLTDDYNPIDFMRADEALRWRKRTAEKIIGKNAIF